MLSPRRLPRLLLLVLPLIAVPALARAAAPRTDADSPVAITGHAAGAPGVTIAVTDFSGPDKDLGRFISDTLLTDLAQSPTLRLVERGEIRRALTELKLQSTGLVATEHVQQLGKLVSADRLIVGSYLLRDDRIIVNARLLDVRTARLVPGGAANAAGDRHDLLAITHRLAKLFHRRLTGHDLLLDDDPPGSVVEPAPDSRVQPDADDQRAAAPGPQRFDPPRAAAPVQPLEPEALARLKAAGIIPQPARANAPVSEAGLSGVVGRLARRLGSQTDVPLTPTGLAAPVARIRALVALVKVALSPDQVAAYRLSDHEQAVPDAADVPGWGIPYVSASLEQGLWRSDRPLHPREPATWAFVAEVVVHLPVLDSTPDSPSAPAARLASRQTDRDDREPGPEPGAYTGLVIDARDLSIQRTMGPRILDEDGNILYPDPNHVPELDALQDRGMAAYAVSGRDARRAGDRPLIVRAIDTTGPGRDDVVVSRRTAQRIRDEERHGHFLHRWAIVILVDPGN